MAQRTADEIAQRAFNLGLLDERQLQEVWGSFGSRSVPLDDFVQSLVGRGFMTNYQVERLIKGERSGFFFGDYKVCIWSAEARSPAYTGPPIARPGVSLP